MNCKQGDLAIVVRSEIGNLGRIIRVLKCFERGWGPEWSYEGNLVCPPGALDGRVSDAALRPLRGDLLDEETETGRELVHAR
jgi:hypothetical protein